MIIPIEITADRIEPAGLHLFQHITPEIRAGQTKRMKLARINEDALTVDQQRVMIVSDCVRLTGRLAMRDARVQSGAKEEKADPDFLDRGRRRLKRVVGNGGGSRSIRIGSGDRGEHRCNPLSELNNKSSP